MGNEIMEQKEKVIVQDEFMAAFDCGNANTDSIINTSDGQRIQGKHQTVISLLFELPTFPKEELAQSVANLSNNLIVNISSKSIRQSGFYAFGIKADTSGGFTRNLDIGSGEKSKDDIPIIATLATLASTAVKNQYLKTQKLPDVIELNVKYSTALPAREYTGNNPEKLAARYMNGPHMVDVYVTDTPVHVYINFLEVKVTQEGNPTVFVLIENKDESFFEEFNNKYNVNYTNKDFRKLKILIVDIGDGTTEYIYTINGVPVTDQCRGERRGVGHAAEKAQSLFLNTTKQSLEVNRQKFMRWVLDNSSRFHKDAVFAMKQADFAQSMMIMADIKKIYKEVLSGDVDLITVSGGGACEFKDCLQEDLYNFADQSGVKVFWFPDEMAPVVNVTGLDILNKKLFFRKK